MGVDLYRGTSGEPDAEDFQLVWPAQHFNWTGWGWLLRTARANGWRPAGTDLDGHDEWDGGYNSNDGQRVPDDDARALAEALDRGWPYLGESARWNEMVRQFVIYCRAGGFVIW